MIEFKNVSKVYDTGTEAVHNANFKIDKGEFVFLVGSSGSGKSTLIKLILKEEEPTRGNIIINGKDTTFLKPKRVPFLRRSMGVVFQDFRLLPDKTVYENVAFALECVGDKGADIRPKVLKALERVGLKDKVRSFPKELSGGEQQRVCIARAIVNEPKLLVCDEPTGNLDPMTSKEIMDVISNINNDLGTTVIMATHDKEIVNRMKKRVLVINSGMLVGDYKKGSYKSESD